MFTAGFEKEAGLKHWITAGLMAATPTKSKADMVGTLRNALGKTELSRSIGKNLEEHAEKLKSLRLLGRQQRAAAQKGAGKAGAAAASKGYALDLKDGNKLQLSYDKYKIHAKPGEVGATADLGSKGSLSLNSKGRGHFALGFEREF